MRSFIIGWELAKSSWAAICDNKRLMIFPLLALLSQIVVIVAYATQGDFLGLLPAIDGLSEDGATLDQKITGFGALFLIYMVFNTMTIFFNVALISSAGRALSGRPAGVMQGFWDAFSRIHYVLIWAAILSTIAILFNMMERHKRVRAVIRWLLGATWGVLTYLVLPVMVFERVNPFKAIGRSKDLIFKNWGEGLGGSIGMGAISFVMMLPAIGMIACGITMHMPLLILAGYCWVLLVMLWGSTARAFVNVAVYALASHKELKTDYFPDLGGVFYAREGQTLDPNRRRMDNNIKGAGGGTPLHDAAGGGHLAVVQVMLKRGANAFALDENGETALDRARARGDREVIEYLEEWMANHNEEEIVFKA